MAERSIDPVESNQLLKASSAYIQAATSDNTRRAYQSDINHFVKAVFSLPATPDCLIRYLESCANSHNPRTLHRRMTALRQWHQLKGEDDPTQDPTVKKTLMGIRRLHGRPRQQAMPLTLKDLDAIVASLDEVGTLKSIRDKSLLLVGFFAALRRSELVALTWEQINFVSEGMIITLPRSKTDQSGQGAQCAIPFGRDAKCPVRALLAWRQAAGGRSGPIFKRLSKYQTIGTNPISAHQFNAIIKQSVKSAGLPFADQYSGHSVRRGFATESARLGASLSTIKHHGRWLTTKTVVEYIEAGRQFSDSAVNVMFAES